LAFTALSKQFETSQRPVPAENFEAELLEIVFVLWYWKPLRNQIRSLLAYSGKQAQSAQFIARNLPEISLAGPSNPNKHFTDNLVGRSEMPASDLSSIMGCSSGSKVIVKT
jgi:hypothetical protein